MDYQALETELTDRMNAYFAATPINDDENSAMLNTLFKARRMPENTDEFTRPGEKNYVNIHYTDSVYAKPKSTSEVIQDETVMVSFFLQCRTLRGDDGAQNLVKHVKQCMMGYKPANGRKMYINAYGDWNTEDGSMINPFIEFAFTTLSVQKSDEPAPIGGKLKTVDVNDNTN